MTVEIFCRKKGTGDRANIPCRHRIRYHHSRTRTSSEYKSNKRKNQSQNPVLLLREIKLQDDTAGADGLSSNNNTIHTVMVPVIIDSSLLIFLYSPINTFAVPKIQLHVDARRLTRATYGSRSPSSLILIFCISLSQSQPDRGICHLHIVSAISLPVNRMPAKNFLIKATSSSSRFTHPLRNDLDCHSIPSFNNNINYTL